MVTSDQTLKGSLDKSVKDADEDESMAEEQKTETIQNSPSRDVDTEIMMQKYLIPRF